MSFSTANGVSATREACTACLTHCGWTGVEKSSGQRRRVGRHFTVGCARAGDSTGAGHFPDADDFAGGWLDGEMWLINPFNGDTLDEHTLDVWLKGNISPIAELFNEDLDEADNAEVIRKLRIR